VTALNAAPTKGVAMIFVFGRIYFPLDTFHDSMFSCEKYGVDTYSKILFCLQYSQSKQYEKPFVALS